MRLETRIWCRLFEISGRRCTADFPTLKPTKCVDLGWFKMGDRCVAQFCADFCSSAAPLGNCWNSQLNVQARRETRRLQGQYTDITTMQLNSQLYDTQ